MHIQPLSAAYLATLTSKVLLLQMLDVTLPFDEVALLEQNTDYLKRACNLPNVPLSVLTFAAGSEPVPGPGLQPLPGKPAPRIHTRPVAQ